MVFALLTQKWAFPASPPREKGRVSGHPASRLPSVLTGGVSWGGDGVGVGGERVPRRTWDWPEGEREEPQAGLARFLWEFGDVLVG